MELMLEIELKEAVVKMLEEAWVIKEVTVFRWLIQKDFRRPERKPPMEKARASQAAFANDQPFPPHDHDLICSSF